jgi:hypothetical protein
VPSEDPSTASRLLIADLWDPVGSFPESWVCEGNRVPAGYRERSQSASSGGWPMTLNAVYLSQSIRRAFLRVLLFWRTSQGSDQFAYAVRDAK